MIRNVAAEGVRHPICSDDHVLCAYLKARRSRLGTRVFSPWLRLGLLASLSALLGSVCLGAPFACTKRFNGGKVGESERQFTILAELFSLCCANPLAGFSILYSMRSNILSLLVGSLPGSGLANHLFLHRDVEKNGSRPE